MATKEAVFSLKVDTGSSVNDIKSFDQAVKGLNKDVNTLQKTVDKNEGTDIFAQKLAALNAKVEAGGLTMREMTKTMKEYQNIAAAAGMESPVGQQAIANAAELKDGIGDIKSQVTALSSDTKKLDTVMGGLQGGAAIFQGISSAMALAGVEDEQLMKTMVKMQAVQGVMNSLNEVAIILNKEHVVGIQIRAAWEKIYAFAVGTSTGAMKLFRTALLATGVGAIIVGIGLLIANMEAVYNAVVKALKWLGLMEDDSKAKESHAKRMARIDKQMEKEHQQREAAKQAFENGQKQYDREIALADALGKSTVQLQQDKINASIKYQKEQIKEIEFGIQQFEQVQAMFPLIKGMGEKEKAEAKKKLNDMKEDIKDSENEINIIKINANKEAAAEAKTQADKLAAIEKTRLDNIAEMQRQLDEEIMKALNDFEDSKQTTRQLEENKINDYYFNLITQAEINKKSKEDIAQLEAAQAEKLRKNTEKFDKEDQQKYEDSLKKRQTALRMFQGYVLTENQVALIDFDNAQKEEVKTLEDNLAAKLISQDMYFRALEAMKVARGKKVIELDKKTAADARDANVKKFEEDTAALSAGLATAAQGLDLAGQMNTAINDIQDAKLAAMQKETDAHLGELEIRKNAELNNANLTAAQKEAINKKYADAAYALQKKQFDEQEKLRKQQFIREKALKVASIAISTAQAVMEAIATGGGVPAGIPFGVATGIVGAAQLAAVMSTKYEGGTAPSMPDVGSGSTSTATATQIGGGSTNAQTTSLADYLPGGANGPPISQVVVLESDITGTQQKVQTQQSLSTY